MTPHAAGRTHTSTANYVHSSLVSKATPELVPIICVVGGGPVGSISTTVVCHGTVCGSPLNELGSGLVFTAVVVV